MNVYTPTQSLDAMKPERIAQAVERGVVLLDYNPRRADPESGIYLVESRPRGFKGCRTANDPAATAILMKSGANYTMLHKFNDFDRALNKAFKIATQATS
jgi:hypothetical protein